MHFRSVKSDELSKNLEVDEKKGVVRVTDYDQTMVISDDGQGCCKSELKADEMEMLYFYHGMNFDAKKRMKF